MRKEMRGERNKTKAEKRESVKRNKNKMKVSGSSVKKLEELQDTLPERLHSKN